MPREIAPARGFGCDAVNVIGVLENVFEGAEFTQPIGLAPVLAVEMAAAMAGNVMAFRSGKADLFEPVGDLLL